MTTAIKEADELLPDPKEEVLPSESAPLRGTPHPGYYREMEAMLHGKQTRKIQPKPPLVIERIDNVIALKLYDTDIIRVWPDGSVVVSAGTWPTKLTMTYLNSYLPSGFKTYLAGKGLYWSETGKVLTRMQPLTNGDTIDSSAGILTMQAPAEYKRKAPPSETRRRRGFDDLG